MAEIENLEAATELQAVNEILAAAGEDPLDALSSGHPDEDLALESLRNATRQLQEDFWKFNSEFHLQLAPDTEDFTWTDPDGTTIDLNLWEVPANLADWEVSRIPEQMGYSDGLDLQIRLSKQYTDGGDPVKVFYDRENNRDGLDADEYDYLWLNVAWYFDYEDMPPEARQLVIYRAARRFVRTSVGSSEIMTFTREDEQDALRNFLRKQSNAAPGNVFDHPERRAYHGRAHGKSRRVFSKNRRL